MSDSSASSSSKVKEVRVISVIVVCVQILIDIELFIFEFRNVKVKDFTRSILNLTPEFVKHSGESLNDKCSMARVRHVWHVWWTLAELAQSQGRQSIPYPAPPKYQRMSEEFESSYAPFHCHCYHCRHE
jgi:hypothetical protein